MNSITKRIGLAVMAALVTVSTFGLTGGTAFADNEVSSTYPNDPNQHGRANLLVTIVPGPVGDTGTFRSRVDQALTMMRDDADGRLPDGDTPFTYTLLSGTGDCAARGYGADYRVDGNSYQKCVNVVEEPNLKNAGEACYGPNCVFSYGANRMYAEVKFLSGYVSNGVVQTASVNTIEHEIMHTFGMNHHGVTGGLSGNDYKPNQTQSPATATGAQNSGGGVSYGKPFQPGVLGHWSRRGGDLGTYPVGAWANSLFPGGNDDGKALRNINAWEGQHLRDVYTFGHTSAPNRY